MGALTILVTGAHGFIGRETVKTAQAHGHSVRALVRRETTVAAENRAETFIADLADNPDLVHALNGVDVVVHTAAAMSGDAEITARDTVKATQNLLSAMAEFAPNARLVLLSSIMVYDANGTPKGGQIDESTSIETTPQRRDGYTRAKLAQEAVVFGAVKSSNLGAWVLRAGAVFGPGRIWNAHIGVCLGPLLLRLGGGYGDTGEIPLVRLEHCAKAIVIACEKYVSPGQVQCLNLVDDALPDRAKFIAQLTTPPRFIVPVPWLIFDILGSFLGLFPGVDAHLPGLLRPRVLRARMRPQTYCNAAAKNVLDWAPGMPFANAMHIAQSGENAAQSGADI